MDLFVRTAELRACANRLAANADDVPTARHYADSHLAVGDTGIFVQVAHVNDQVRAHLQTLFQQLAVVADGSAQQLRATALMYDHTDHGVAQAMDRKLTEVAPLPPGSTYDDVTDQLQDTTPEEPDDYEPPDLGGGDDETPTSPGGGGGSW